MVGYYDLVLSQRAHSLPAVPVTFGTGVAIFERVWYGRDAAEERLVTESEQRLGALRASCVTAPAVAEEPRVAGRPKPLNPEPPHA